MVLESEQSMRSTAQLMRRVADAIEAGASLGVVSLSDGDYWEAVNCWIIEHDCPGRCLVGMLTEDDPR